MTKPKPIARPSAEDDASLTIMAMAKIVRAQQRSTLSHSLYIRRLPTQIVLEKLTESDFAWVKKNYPGTTERRTGFGIKKRRGSRKVFEEAIYTSLLREKIGEESYFKDHPPRLEVWGILLPHECRDFVGHARDEGSPFWRCGAYGCRRRITVTRARDLGLLPPKVYR